jgi:hypothetical protein
MVKSPEEAGADDIQEEVDGRTLTLYHCTDEDGTYKVTEVKSGPLEQADLTSEVGQCNLTYFLPPIGIICNVLQFEPSEQIKCDIN